MTPKQHKDLWTIFLEEAHRVLGELAGRQSPDKPFRLEEIKHWVGLLSRVESSAWMVGAEDVAEAIQRLRLTLAGFKTIEAPLLKDLNRCLVHLRHLLDLLADSEASEQELGAELQSINDFVSNLQEDLEIKPLPEEPDPTTLAPDQWKPQVDPDMVEAFVEETRERLLSVGNQLMALEQQAEDKNLVASIFRDLHTIKGSSAFVGLSLLNKLAHAAEDLVGEIRDGRRKAGSESIDLLLMATDTMNKVLDRAVSGQPLSDPMLDQVLAALRIKEANPSPAPDTIPQQSGIREEPALRGSDLTSDRQTIRVDFSKLDLLLNLVGELVLDKAAIRSVLDGIESTIRAMDHQTRRLRRGFLSKSPLDSVFGGLKESSINEELGRVERVMRDLSQELDISLGSLDFVAGQLRDQVMKLRMIPVLKLFIKQQRTVRDLCRAQNKKVRLELVGQDTELDKMLVEQLDEPLLHLVRNAIDHGIELPQNRVEQGKPAEGFLRIKAEHRGSQFVVEISDDGRGLDPEKIRAKGVEKGLLTQQQAAELSEEDALNMIFAPGFSTARTITDLSGRGVGLDVVREVVGRLRGTVEIKSQKGQGTTFVLSLPLTLAIRQVLLLRIAGELCALPLDYVQRSMVVRPEQIRRVMDRDVLELNGAHLPVIPLDEVLGMGSSVSKTQDMNIYIVLVRALGQNYGLACDGLEGKREIVIKSLGDLLPKVQCVAGATLVEDRVVLILDLPNLIQMWIQRDNPSLPRKPEPAERARASHTVLLVEDSALMRNQLEEQFRQIGFEVLTAADGLQAVELSRARTFDLVSTDALMPNMDGYELTRTLRKDPKHRTVPILMISVRGERIDKVRGFDAGVDAYLVKPADTAELDQVVKKLMRSRSKEKDQ